MIKINQLYLSLKKLKLHAGRWIDDHMDHLVYMGHIIWQKSLSFLYSWSNSMHVGFMQTEFISIIFSRTTFVVSDYTWSLCDWKQNKHNCWKMATKHLLLTTGVIGVLLEYVFFEIYMRLSRRPYHKLTSDKTFSDLKTCCFRTTYFRFRWFKSRRVYQT